MSVCAVVRGVILGGVLAVASAGVAAESVKTLFLSPDRFEARVGEKLSVRTLAGAAADAQPEALPIKHIAWCFIRVSGTQENLEEERLRQASDDAQTLPITIEHPGVTLVGLDTTPAIERISGRDLAAFLANRTILGTTHDDVRRISARRTYRVRRVQSAKTLVRVPLPGSEAPQSATAQSKSGQAVEIRPLADPTSVRVGSDLPVRVYAGGAKRAGALVTATNLATRKSQKRSTDPIGATDVSIDAAGIWRIEFHHAEPLPDDPEADWAIYSATLTFEVKKGEAGK